MQLVFPLVLAAVAAHTYLVGFDISNLTATSGVVNVDASETALLNSNLPPPGSSRRAIRVVKATKPLDAKSLRLGRWQVKGDCKTGNVALEEVTPAYETRDGITLGEGETIFGRTYRYASKWSGKYGSKMIGIDADHKIKNVVFENISVNGTKLTADNFRTALSLSTDNFEEPIVK